MSKTKRAFMLSVISLLACCAMLIGSTFAWFTDSVSSMNNIITSGNLDLEMYWTDDLASGTWYNVEDDAYNTIFNYDNWEPGYTEVRYIKLVNAGKLALNYELSIVPQGEVGKLAEVINVYFAGEGVTLADRSDLSQLSAIGLLDTVMNGGATASGTLLADGQTSPLGHASGEIVMTLALNMLTSAGNEYQNESVGNGFSVAALATQAPFEKDGFGDDYDKDATFPELILPTRLEIPVAAVNNVVTADTTVSDGGVSVTLPAGFKLADGVDAPVLTTKPLEASSAGITVVNNEILIPVDVHIEGMAADNTVPAIINLGAVLPKHLNMGNYALVHVENGVSVTMNSVSSEAALAAHNDFYYDSETGEVTVAMASFSEVALLANMDNGWTGGTDTSWYTKDINANEFIIYNADQLDGLSKLVGGMVDLDDDGEVDDQVTFEGKTIKLIADIDLNDAGAEASENGKVFYPIGYYNNKGYNSNHYADPDDILQGEDCSGVSSSVSSFEGTFDGNGHTIKNFYQNTWEMFGDYNNGYPANSNYYKDAMGLFGYVYSADADDPAIVKNLTIENFSCDGEFAPTGCVSAFARNAVFENIALTECNPRVYNTGNGGIVGIGFNDEDTAADKITFKNITIDNTNKITALWGSWDVGCAGLIGMHRGQGSVDMINCHVACQIDAFNDVCGNYQYYWYRYSAMLIGSMDYMTTDKDGYIIPNLDNFKAEDCTVHFGEWNNYYYCELVENSLASYTHDHQFSRLTEIASLDEIKSGDTWTKTGNFLLIEGEDKTCYHIRKDENGSFYEHSHDSMGTETVNGEVIPVEDHRIVYLPFNQLFQGYGWGVKNQALTHMANYPGLDIVKLDDFGDPNMTDGSSLDKFVSVVTEDTKDDYGPGVAYPISNFFAAGDYSASINKNNVQVTVSPVDPENHASVGFVYNLNTENWLESTLEFTNAEAVDVYVTITDYYFCNSKTILLSLGDGNYGDIGWD